MMALKRVISGGQTGAGPDPSLADFGLLEHASPDYPPRTRANVEDATATLVFGRPTRLTIGCCHRHKPPRPYRVVYWNGRFICDRDTDQLLLRAWLSEHQIEVLNVAGNRESRNPGIEAAVRAFLVEALR